MQWSRSFKQDSPKIIPSPWGLHCPLRVNIWETCTTNEELSTQNKGPKLHVGKLRANTLEKGKGLETCLQGDHVYSLK